MRRYVSYIRIAVFERAHLWRDYILHESPKGFVLFDLVQMFQNNRTTLFDHFHDSERQSSDVWTCLIEQTISTSPCIWRMHQAIQFRLESVLERSSPGGISPKRPLIPGRVLQDWARQRPFDNISQTISGQFGLAKFAL